MALKVGARRLEPDTTGGVGAFDGARVPRHEKRGHARHEAPQAAKVRLSFGSLHRLALEVAAGRTALVLRGALGARRPVLSAGRERQSSRLVKRLVEDVAAEVGPMRFGAHVHHHVAEVEACIVRTGIVVDGRGRAAQTVEVRGVDHLDHLVTVG